MSAGQRSVAAVSNHWLTGRKGPAARDRRCGWRWLGIFFLATALNVWAQRSEGYLEPRLGQVWLREAYMGVEVESESEKQTIPGSNTTTRDRLYVMPTLGVGMGGFIYHPNLLQFHIDAEGGVGMQNESLHTTGGSQPLGAGNGMITLQRYDADMLILKQKPYASSVFANKGETFRDYDFFTRVKVDTDRYGVRTGYNAGPVPFHITAYHQDEDVIRVLPISSLKEDSFSLDGKVARQPGANTEFNYTVVDRAYTQSLSSTLEGVNQQARVTDLENFGTGDWIRLNSSASYDDQQGMVFPTMSFNESERLMLEHTDDLQSSYNYSFYDRESGSVNGLDNTFSAQLRHQLYDSLTSTLEAHGQNFNMTSPGNTLDITRYGIGLSENYTKRLWDWGRLTAGYSGRYDTEQRQSSGVLLHIVSESITLTDGVTTFLAQPRVDTTSIKVTDSTGLITYTVGLDYLIIVQGLLTEIRRVPGGLIPNGATVLVSYNATAQPSDQFETLGNQFQVRLDLFNGLLGIYGRYNRSQNFGGQSLVLQNISDVTVGTDVHWKWVRAGAEYEDFESNLAPFVSRRLFENFTFQPLPAAVLSLDFTQAQATFLQSNLERTEYSFMGRFSARIIACLSGTLESGMRIERGPGFDQDLAVARAGLDFKMGKLTARLGYEFTDQDYLGQLRQRNFFYLRAKRMF